MPLAPTPLRRAHATAVLAAAAVLAAGAAYAQIDPPALSLAWPNRADVGDTVTLVGTGLNQDATTIAAAFGSGLACPITRRTATAVDITVPPGAADGYVSVTVSGHLPDGTPTSAVSNGVPLLVIWTFFDSSGLAPVGLYHTPANEVSPGAADHLQLELQGYGSDWRGQDILSRVRHDRTSIWLYQGSGGSPHLRGGAQTAVDPLSGSVVAVASWGTSPVQALVNLSTGATLAQFPNDPNGTSLTPLAVRFDSSGVLYVGVINEQNLVSVFRFAPGDPIAFDFSGPASMVPGGVALQGQWCAGGDMALGGDGVAYLTTCPLVGGGQTAEVLRVPGTSGALFDTFQLPDLRYADGTEWHLAANCRGAAFAAGSCWSSECNNTMTLFDLTNGGAIATLGGVGLYRGFGTDGYDDFFVHGVISVEGRWRLGLRRLTVADLPVGFYGSPPPGVTATPTASAAVLAPVPDRSTIPKEWLELRGAATAPPWRRARWKSPAAHNGGGTDGSAPSSPTVIPSQVAILARPLPAPLPPALPPSVFCPPPGHLVVEIDGRYYTDGEEATIPLGKELDLAAWWYRGLNVIDKVAVQWKLENPQPEWHQEHAAAAASGLVESQAASEMAVLFPDDVLLLFDEGNPDATVSDRKVRPIHKGNATLKLHAPSTPGGGAADMALKVAVTYARVHLGSDWTYYDTNILQWANAFGFPPQYIKGLIQRESRFNPADYRYEPAGWDFGDSLGGIGVMDQLDSSYFLDFRFSEPGGIPHPASPPRPQGRSLSQADIDARTGGPPLHLLSGIPVACQPVSPGIGSVSAWYLYLGSNGYVNDSSVPPAPCGQRMSWEPTADIYRWDSERPQTRPPFAKEATWWFYQNQTYVAQTFLAASYGLVQTGYAADLKDMKWWSKEPERRHGANVVEPNTNIYLGARWLAWPAHSQVFADSQAAAAHSEMQFSLLVGQLLCRYNTGKVLSACDYSGAVIANAANFVPSL